MTGTDDLVPGFDLATADLGTVAPEEFARIVRATPARQAARLMAGPHRERVLDEVFRRMEVLFRPEAAGRRETLIRWRVTAEGGGADTYETRIADGRLTATAGTTARAARLTLTMTAPDLLRLAAGAASGPVLFLTRRIRAQGDLLLAAALTRLFDLPGV